ncbi:MAG: hypothetical protein ACKOCT_12170, partial [Alphaproteobacteria bacterium]
MARPSTTARRSTESHSQTSPRRLAGRSTGWATAAVFAALLASPAAGHEPGTIQVTLAKASDTGIANLLADTTGRGDTQVSFSFFNSDPEVDVLLVFPPCAFDGEGQRKSKLYRVDTLDSALAGASVQEAKA